MAGISTKQIKNRIRSMASTKQITKAMETVAASKLRRAQALAVSSRPYSEIVCTTMDSFLASGRGLSSPYLQKQSGQKSLYIVIAGDRGMAGGYNSSIFKLVTEAVSGRNAVILPIGKKSVDFFRSQKIPLWADFGIEGDSVKFDDCRRLALQLSSAYLAGEFTELHIACTQYISPLSQVPKMQQLLPLPLREDRHFRCETIFEPGPEALLGSMVPEYLGGVLYNALCESRAAEHAARRNAMQTASSNADEMITDLRKTYNRIRQTAITQEITEIVAGS